jgi:hypothetical protein
MKSTVYDMVKLGLKSVDLVVLHLLVQQTMKRRPDADWQRLDLAIAGAAQMPRQSR